jgi:predicted O-methyltransferase YrrM
MAQIDMAYIDGNHRLEPTLRYFNQMYPNLHADSVVVFDDIHWSAEMEDAWAAIKKDERVTLTIDLFFIGLAFFKKDFKVKQHFTIRF